jgi:hypothetical protein
MVEVAVRVHVWMTLVWMVAVRAVIVEVAVVRRTAVAVAAKQVT